LIDLPIWESFRFQDIARLNKCFCEPTGGRADNYVGSALPFAVLAVAPVLAAASNPMAKVLELMDECAAKVTADGEAADKTYKEYFEWCDDVAKNSQFEIKTAKSNKEELEAQIGELTAAIGESNSKIEKLTGSIAADEKELAEATAIREKEAADFAASEKELMATVDTLDRAVSIISEEMSKNPAAALTQIDTSSMSGLIQSLSVVIDAAGFTGSDQKKLLALVQAQDGDSDTGAPAAATYKSQSGGIVEVLDDLKEKAEGELAEARKAESTAKHNYEMMKQSLEDQIAADTKNMNEQKAAKEEAEVKMKPEAKKAVKPPGVGGPVKKPPEPKYAVPKPCGHTSQVHPYNWNGDREWYTEYRWQKGSEYKVQDGPITEKPVGAKKIIQTFPVEQDCDPSL